MSDTNDVPSKSDKRARAEAVHKWSATIAGLAALMLSLYNFAELHRKPRIDATLPHIVYIRQVNKITYFYIQPTISTRLKTQDVEVIREARLQVAPTGSISSLKKPSFFWFNTGEWVFDIPSGKSRYRKTSDPAPLIVSQDKPQQPSFLFKVDNWSFQSGRYKMALILSRAGNRNPLTVKFCLKLSKEDISKMHGKPETNVYPFRNDVPKSRPANDSPACYQNSSEN